MKGFPLFLNVCGLLAAIYGIFGGVSFIQNNINGVFNYADMFWSFGGGFLAALCFFIAAAIVGLLRDIRNYLKIIIFQNQKKTRGG